MISTMLKIIEKVMNEEINSLMEGTDLQLEEHVQKTKDAIAAFSPHDDSSMSPLEARLYMDSCGPALNCEDEPTWATLPKDELEEYNGSIEIIQVLVRLRDQMLKEVRKTRKRARRKH